jgi:hypothetical protein
LLKEARYDGTPIVLMQSTDLTVLTNLAPVAKNLMEKAGFRVDMQSMDWQTLVTRRAKKDPPSPGGWHGFLNGSGDYHFVGVKYRLKWLPVRPMEDAEGWFLGANAELSRVGYKFSESPWTTELRPIVGYKGKDWLFAFNPILDWDLSNGLASWDPTFVPSLKLNLEVWKGIALGAEYYSEMGKLGHIEPWDKEDNRLYATVDVDMKPLVFNFGVGRGLAEASDKWTIKATHSKQRSIASPPVVEPPGG